MRHPIHRQLLWPMLLVVLFGSSVTALLAAWMGLRTVQQSEHERLQQLAGTLTDAGFPLTEAVLKRMSELSGAEFLTLEPDGSLLRASREISSADQELLSRLPLVSPAEISLGERPMRLSSGDYRAVRIAVRSAAAPRISLVILTAQSHGNDLAFRAAVPPLLAGLVAAGGAAVIAVLLSRRFVVKIHDLAARAEQLADGRFQSQPLPAVDDELRDLAVALNTTADKLTRYEVQIRAGERLQTLGRLGAGMAHQLRNAITGARMALDLHRADLPADLDQESLSVAVRQLALMEAYLQRFLSMGRGEPPTLREIDLSMLVTDALQLVEPICRHHGIIVDWEPPVYPVRWRGDAESLRQMLLNLLMNAIEAVQPLPRAKRRIAAELDQGDDAKARLRICDHGPGPSPQLAESLFDRFVTDKPDGTGLGLAVAQEIAHSHGGKITWRRDAERTVFDVELAVNAPATSEPP